MRGWAELLLCGGVLAACWTRTPVGDLGRAALSAIAGDEVEVDVLASFRTQLPAPLEQALAVALADSATPLEAPPGAFHPGIRLAIRSHLGDAALAEIEALDIDAPEAALETWAIGAEVRDRAIRRAEAAGAPHPERLASYAPYLPARTAAIAHNAVSDTLSLATVLDLAWPVDPGARVSSGFGYRDHPTLKTRKLHEGVDIAVPVGTPVFAAAAGAVSRAREDAVNGWHVVLDHGNRVSTAYCHASRLQVERGQAVARGDPLMESGNSGRSTGPHLHFGLRIGGRPVDPGPFRSRAPGPRS
jgi:murein DD-endopeptidase MepM/ murein hydrolase activator NlpD